ncbi:MAG: FkbM family methyltransferase [Pedobacter sp.]|nr:MAG: FkbM family methyltransferase [Pedobacter sp.]
MFSKKRQSFTHLKYVVGDQTSSKMQDLLKDSGALIHSLSEKNLSKFEIINDELVIEINGIKAYIESEEDLFIINEIFKEHCYGFFSNQKFILIDIGLNIGMSSLYFNKLDQILKIYSFEPVPNTFDKCIRNLELNNNPIKIKPFNFGLGNSNRIDSFSFSEMFKGSVGQIELSEYKKNTSKELIEVSVKIKEASKIINQIIKENPGENVLIKMDCEGAEYEILENLKESGVLNSISMLILEWHGVEFLNKLDYLENFNCFWNKNSETTGMLYGYNKLN